jgi:hypothetical protein
MRTQNLLKDHGAILLAGCLLLLAGVVLQPSAGALQDENNTGTPAQIPPLPPGATNRIPAIATAMAGNGMIAVTGIDLTGSSVLYLVDTNAKQLAVYQASGGSDSMQGVKLVGARKIDLDLQLEGLNDKSQYSYEDLEKRFQENARPVGQKKKP